VVNLSPGFSNQKQQENNFLKIFFGLDDFACPIIYCVVLVAKDLMTDLSFVE
jgi:hypothetical protein